MSSPLINLDTQLKGSKWPSYTATDSGTANNYAVSGIPLAPSLRGGSVIIFKAAHTNTGASTLAVNGGSAIAIKKLGGSALSAGDIVASSMVTCVYDSVSTTFLYLTPATLAASQLSGQIDLTTQVSGILPVANGGSGSASPSLVAGSNVTITGSWPNQTVAASGGGGGGSGLFGPVMSSLPTSAGIGYTTWVNQGGTAVVSDASLGVAIFDATGVGGTIIRGRKKTVPATPYSAIALISLDLYPGNNAGCGFGWTDGTKLHLCWFQYANLGIGMLSYNSVTSFAGGGLQAWSGGSYVWLKLKDDGTTVSASFSLNGGASWILFFALAKASAFLGATGYSSLIFGIGPSSVPAGLTVMSYQETSP